MIFMKVYLTIDKICGTQDTLVTQILQKCNIYGTKGDYTFSVKKI